MAACSGHLVTPEFEEAMQAYNWLQKGFLPFGPSVWEHPNRMLEALEILTKAAEDGEKK